MHVARTEIQLQGWQERLGRGGGAGELARIKPNMQGGRAHVWVGGGLRLAEGGL